MGLQFTRIEADFAWFLPRGRSAFKGKIRWNPMERRSRWILWPRSSCDRGHQISLPTGWNGPKIALKFPFKNDVLPCFFLTLDRNRVLTRGNHEELKILLQICLIASRINQELRRNKGVMTRLNRMVVDYIQFSVKTKSWTYQFMINRFN